jgi:hypothetical protein
MRGCVGFFFLVLLCGLGAPPAEAQLITRVQPLSFGTFVLKNNSAAHTLRVSRTNAVTAAAAFALFTNPVRGEYDLSGFPASTPFTASFSATPITAGGLGAGESFSLGTFIPGSGLTTDASGNAQVRFGATLTTSGSGINYPDGAYEGELDITINY